VEHALCPLDPASSLVPNLMHEATYQYTDKNKHQRIRLSTIPSAANTGMWRSAF